MTWPTSLVLSLALATAAMPGIAVAQEVVQPLGPNDADRLAASMRRIAANPNDLAALVEAGEWSLRLGDLSGAASLFARADKINSRYGPVKAGMGSILLKAERPGEALRFFQMAEAYGAPPATYAADRGLAYDLVGQQERAQRDYRLALKRHPDDETVRRYALSLGISGRRDLALAQLMPLLRRADRGAWRARAFVLAMTGDAAEASRIATTMMPPGMATGLQPFFQQLASLGPVDRAFAVHFGEVRATPERLADARLTPAFPALGPDPDAQGTMVATARAPVVPEPRRNRRERREARQPMAQQAQLAQPAAVAAAPVPSAAQSMAAQVLPARVVAPAAAGVAAAVSSRPGLSPTTGAATPLARAGGAAPVAVAANGAVQQAPLAGVTSNRAALSSPSGLQPSSVAVARTAPTPLPGEANPSLPAVAVATPATAAMPGAMPPASIVRGVTAILAVGPAGSTSMPAATALAASTSAKPVSTAATGTAASPVAASPAPVPAATTRLASATGAIAPTGTLAGAGTQAPPAASSAPAPAVTTVALPPSAVATDSAAPAASLPKVSEDTILAKIVANLSIPAAELGIAPPSRPADAAPESSSAAAADVVDSPAAAAKPGRPAAPSKKENKSGAAKRDDGDEDTTGRARSKPARNEAAIKKTSTKSAPDDDDRPGKTSLKKAAADKALADKAAADGKKAARSNPERIWVQVAGGASADDLPRAWAAAKAKAPAAFAGRTGYTTPLRATNRVLAGPFKTDAEARRFINQLAKNGVPAFAFTSEAGQPVTKLPAE